MVLLVVMVLLTLMSLMGLTLVMVTAQGRLSALAASRRGLQSEHDNQELATVMTQVAVGSTDGNSSFGAHGLLEDLYGLPQFFGRIAPATPVLPVGETVVGTSFTSGGNNGTLLQLVVVAAAPSGAAGLGPQTASQYVLPQYSGAFCGQVMTMLTGTAAGQSGRVVGYYFNPVAQIASLQVSSFGGVVPQPGDEFMINGRPFAGTGFGLDLTKFQPQLGAQTTGPWVAPYTQPEYFDGTLWHVGPLLTAIENPLAVVGPTANLPATGMPYAYLPNHARIGLTTWAPTTPAGAYWDPAGPGGANEPYDAPDFQNMMLAMHYWDGGSGVVTPVPTLHRPELVAWYYAQAIANTNPAISMANPGMRRKVILRPEPTDHYFVDTNGNGIWDAREPFQDLDSSGGYSAGDTFLDLNGDGLWTPGETDYAGKTFNPVTGCWYIAANGNWKLDTKAGLDVDNDQDTIPDSVYVDAGLPVHTEADGTLTKNLAAVLCIDLDGKINLNAHGNLSQLDVFRYPYNPYLNALGADGNVGVSPNPWVNPLNPLDKSGNIVFPNTIAGPLTAVGTTTAYVPPGTFTSAPTIDPTYSVWHQRTIPVGQGYGPADVNPLHLFVRSHGQNAALNYYRVFLQGFDGYPNAPSSLPPVDGRYGESTRPSLFGVPGFNLPGVFPPGSYLAPWSMTPGATWVQQWTQSYLNGPRPGWSQWYDPFSTSLLFAAGTSGYWVNDPVTLARFSDIRPRLLEPGLKPTDPYFFDFLMMASGVVQANPHQPTGHGSPSDLHSRGFLATDISGRPYYAGTATLPWQTPPAVWNTVMLDAAVNAYYTGNPALDLLLGNELVQNEGVDTPYELDPRQNSRQGGQNTGNSVNGIPDFAGVDNKLAASEYEGILRYHESGVGGAADSGSLLTRLNNLETAEQYLRTGNTAPQTTQLADDKVRLAATSDSWDLPVPNIALTPQQMNDITMYVDYFSASTGVPLGNATTLNLGNVSLAELARARIFADNTLPPVPPAVLPVFNSPGFTQPPPNPSNITLSFADLALFGNLKNTQQNITLFPTANPAPLPGINPSYPVWPLLAPETILGMRLDVNRLLGNGIDDNGNGVVDEPVEAVWQAGTQDGYPYGEALAYPFSRINTATLGPAGQVNPNVTPANDTGQSNITNMLGVLDLNNDGFYSSLFNATGALGVTSVDPQLTTPALPVYLPNDPTYADMRARQLLARHLYCLMMLLLDDRPYVGNTNPPRIMAMIFNATSPVAATQYPQGVPGGMSYSALVAMPREQAAYVIAQWAINVVDFRDRDSIMTPFEFDLYPFRADDPTEPNVTWNVDDIIDPIGVTTGAAGCSLQPGSKADDAAAWRGLVWGCERPELLMTETVAFHDRGTADTSQGQNINDPTQNPATGKDTVTTNMAMPYDKDFDQVRRPRGSLLVELFNPTAYWDPPQRDLQTNNLQNNPLVGPQVQPWDKIDGNGNQGAGVNLAQVAVGQPVNNGYGPPSSPVWRIAIAYSPWQASESMCYNANANATPTLPAGVVGQPIGGMGRNLSPQNSGQTIDPRVPILPATAIHRVVYFTPFQQGFLTGSTVPANAVPAPGSVVGDVLLTNSFFADPEIFAFNQASGIIPATPPATLMLPPGQYALVAPANQDVFGSGNYYVFAGQNTTTTNTNVYPWSLQLGNIASYNTTAILYGAGSVVPPASPYASAAGVGYNSITSASTTIKPVIGVPIQTNWLQNAGGKAVYLQHNHVALTGGSAAAGPVQTTLRMSVSEPEHGYPLWQNGQIQTVVPNANNLTSLQDDAPYYSSPGTALVAGQPLAPPGGITSFPQHPFDSGQGNPQAGNAPYLQFGDLPNPYVAPGAATQSTTLGYTVLYLQRLANPLQAWDAKMNPYITVDSMPVDLTAYTGDPSGGGAAPPEIATYYSIQQGTPNPPSGLAAGTNWTASAGTATSFDTRRRGYDPKSAANTLLTDQLVPNIWTPLPTSLGNLYSNAAQYGNQYNKGTYSNPMPSNYSVTGGYSTLGYINWEYTGAFYPAGIYTGSNPALVGASGMQGYAYMYNGDPLMPFPWMPWNNRPYISQYELMLVPASSPSSQLQDFGMLGWQAVPPTKPKTMNQYSPTQLTTAGVLPAAQFMETLNFFNNTQTASSGNLLPNLYRIFEFLQVPSRFTGTQDMLDPSQFAGNDAVLATQGLAGQTSHQFHTPFNWLSRYREPGKINLNTVFDPVVFKALADDYPGTLWGMPDPTTSLGFGLWPSVFLSRQGTGAALPVNYTLPPNPVAQFNNPVTATLATYFANPFRPDGAGAFEPPSAWNPAAPPVPPFTAVTVAPNMQLMQQWSYPGLGAYNGVNTTLLRPSPTTSSLALFDDTNFDTTNLNATYASMGVGLAPPYQFRHAGRDPTFQYQMFTRLGNTTTNRSNVYAIWITLGKFEVKSVAVSPQNPDGYALVKPYLDATGNQVTTRGFYIFDRSIPMGFQRGQNTNIEKGILLERVLE
ncbi:MAG TPA: hypothetical protein VJ783_18685 [Pirellulales bacterium]|nr:hypothetical protein [Pirellulales bacterium]